MNIGNAPPNTFIPDKMEPNMADLVDGKVSKPRLIK